MAPRKKTTAFSKVAGPTKAQQSSKFMSIPPELRNRIYKFSFEGEVIKMPERRKGNMQGRTQFPGILMACKQTHFEAVKIYYATVAFRFEDLQIRGSTKTKRLPQWIKKIGQQRKDLITDIHLNNRVVSYRDDEERPCKFEVGAAFELLETASSQVDLAPGVLKVKVRHPYTRARMVEDPIQAYYDRLAELGLEE